MMSADSTSLIGAELSNDYTDPRCGIDLQPLASYVGSTTVDHPSTELQWLSGATDGDMKTKINQKPLITHLSDSHVDKMKPVSTTTTTRRARIYRCRICKKEFSSKSDMQRHARCQHSADELTKRHRCSRCLKSFSTSPQLTQHWLVHNNVRRFFCIYCNKAFKQLSHVQQHQRIHTGERPYKCFDACCNKSFRQLSSLQQHLKSHNITSSMRSQDGASSTHNDSIAKKSKPNRVSAPVGVKPSDLTCQVCGTHCADDTRFFRHVHRHHPEYWRVLAGSRPLCDFIDTASPWSGRRQQNLINSFYNNKDHTSSISGDCVTCNRVLNDVNIKSTIDGGHVTYRHSTTLSAPTYCYSLFAPSVLDYKHAGRLSVEELMSNKSAALDTSGTRSHCMFADTGPFYSSRSAASYLGDCNDSTHYLPPPHALYRPEFYFKRPSYGDSETLFPAAATAAVSDMSAAAYM